jgi:hypothetical protein
MDLSIYQPANLTSLAFIQSFLPTSFTATTVVFSQGAARSYASDWVMDYTGTIQGLPGEITVDVTTIGVNGCFPVALSAVTPSAGFAVLPVFAVGNSSGVTNGSLDPLNTIVPGLVVSTTGYDATSGLPNPGFVPAGYDSYRFVGIVVIDDTGALIPYAMNGSYNSRQVMFKDALQVLSAGALVGPTKVDLRLGDPTNGGILPSSIVQSVNILAEFTNNTADDTAYLIPFGLTSTSQPPIMLKGSANTVPVWSNVVMAVGNDSGIAAIDYSVSATDCTLSLWLAGFTFNPPFLGGAGNVG